MSLPLIVCCVLCIGITEVLECMEAHERVREERAVTGEQVHMHSKHILRVTTDWSCSLVPGKKTVSDDLKVVEKKKQCNILSAAVVGIGRESRVLP